MTSELGGFEWSVFSRANSCKSSKIHDLGVGFEHRPGCEKFESQNLMKIKFLRSYFIFVTCLPREVDGRVIS